jgi:hypothetical protein
VIYIALFRVYKADLLSKIIQTITWGDYSHAGLFYDGQLTEAFWPAVRRRKLADDEYAGIDFFTVPLTPEQEAGIRTYCDKAVAAHEPYSVEGLFRFLWPARLFLGNGKSGDLTRDTFCSQFDIEAFSYGGNFTLLRGDSFKIDPVILSYCPFLVGPVTVK